MLASTRAATQTSRQLSSSQPRIISGSSSRVLGKRSPHVLAYTFLACLLDGSDDAPAGMTFLDGARRGVLSLSGRTTSKKSHFTTPLRRAAHLGRRHMTTVRRNLPCSAIQPVANCLLRSHYAWRRRSMARSIRSRQREKSHPRRGCFCRGNGRRCRRLDTRWRPQQCTFPDVWTR